MNLLQIVKRLAFVFVGIAILFLAYMLTRVPRQQDPFNKKTDLATRISIQRGSNRLDLVRQDKVWMVSQSSGTRFEADDQRVVTLTSALEHVQVEDEISARVDRQADFEVTDVTGIQVILFGQGDKKLAEGVFGKQAPDFSHIYFRYPDRPNVYLARGLIRGELGEADLNGWRRKVLINIPEAQIRSIRITGSDYETKLVRSSETWIVNGKSSDQSQVFSLVGALAHLQADNFADSVPFTYDQLTWASILVEGDGQKVDLRIGKRDAQMKRFPISVGPLAGIAWISETKIDPLLLKPSAFQPKKS